MAGKTALVNGKLVTGTGKMDTRDRIYEATLYCGFSFNNVSPSFNGNWSGNLIVKDENDNTITSLSVGTARNQVYTLNPSTTQTKTAKFNIPLSSKEQHTYTVTFDCGWYTTYTTPMYNGWWGGTGTINDVTDVESVTVVSLSVGESSTYSSFTTQSKYGSKSETFTNP